MFVRGLERLAISDGHGRAARPATRPEGALIALQRVAGNRAVASLLHTGSVSVQRDAAAGHVLAEGDEADVPAPADMDALISEIWPLYAKSEASKAKGGTPMEPGDRKRMVELNRKWTLRGEKDIALTLEQNKQGSPADWFRNVKATPFLGQTVIVHDELKKRLDKAVSKLKDIDETTRNGWVRFAELDGAADQSAQGGAGQSALRHGVSTSQRARCARRARASTRLASHSTSTLAPIRTSSILVATARLRAASRSSAARPFGWS